MKAECVVSFTDSTSTEETVSVQILRKMINHSISKTDDKKNIDWEPSTYQQIHMCLLIDKSSWLVAVHITMIHQVTKKTDDLRKTEIRNAISRRLH